MRPGHFTPDNTEVDLTLDYDKPASMRPGHFTPDNLIHTVQRKLAKMASMRPGHFTPDNKLRDKILNRFIERFNEAGAFHPG